MSDSQERFDLIAVILWRTGAPPRGWEQTADAFHGISLFAEGPVQADARLLSDIAAAYALDARLRQAALRATCRAAQ